MSTRKMAMEVAERGFGWSLLMIVLSTAVFLRASVGLFPYSGAGKPPMFGDYEAQRHWMEVTYNLPLQQWYGNSSGNDLKYWGLDYPPLTAYHSWVMGLISVHINPEWIALETSHGYESYHHKIFMRMTVFFTDVLVYFSATLAYAWSTGLFMKSQLCVTQKMVMMFVILCSPSLVLIDYGHFQYNSISLGLTLWAIVAVIGDWNVFGSMAFCLALNYKQMELYHSLPFFFYLLGRARVTTDKIGDFFLAVVKLGVTVFFIFSFCWIPFYSTNGTQGIHEVVARIFPIGRGLYEDKVASFWCSLSVIWKVRDVFSRTALLWISVGTTLVAVLPSMLDLLRNPTPYRFLLSLVISSLSFYLFSFHVHEKTILLVTLPVNLLILHHPFVVVWFNIVATFSMYPLLIKDGLSISTWAASGLFAVVTSLPLFTSGRPSRYKSLAGILSLVVMLTLCLLSHIVAPPKSLPDIFAVLISCYCCLLFMMTLAYFIHVQASLYSTVDQQRGRTWDCKMSQYITYQIVRRSNINLTGSKDHNE